jgi:hypothetical protein
MAEPEVVPLTQELYKQAVTVLAGMIVDYWRREDVHRLRPVHADHDNAVADGLSCPDGDGVNSLDGDQPPAEG